MGKGIVSIACVLVLSSRCSFPAEQQPLWQVTLQRFACFGHCPVYTVSIDAAGVVVYTGQRFVAVQGVRHDTIGRQQALAVRRQLERLGVWQLPTGWHHRPPVADVPAVALTIREGAAGRTIRFLEFQTPAALRQAARLIDSVARTYRWIGRKHP